MGNCLGCLKKQDTSEPSSETNQSNQNVIVDSINHSRNHSTRKHSNLSEQVDQLVRETLDVIASIVDE